MPQLKPGEYLRATRERLNLRLLDVAQRYGCSVTFLSHIERGKRAIPRIKDFRPVLCEAYGADPVELDRLCVREGEALEVGALRPANRERVFRFAEKLREEQQVVTTEP